MANFKIQYSNRVVPIEEITLADGTTTHEFLHSNIDRTFGSSIKKTISTTSTDVAYVTYLTTTSPVALNHATILNNSDALSFLSIKIVSAGSSGTPDLVATLWGTDPLVNGYAIALAGVGDCCMIPMVMPPANITIYSISATTVANVEIVVGKS